MKDILDKKNNIESLVKLLQDNHYDSDYVETILREKFNFADPMEKIVNF